MNTIVIGGAGFVGSHLVERLLADGDAVDVVDDLSTGQLANLAGARAAGGTLRINTLDAAVPAIADLISLRRPEVIYHLGLLIPGVAMNAARAASAVASTLTVAEALTGLTDSKLVVMLPAAAMYGDVPAREQPVKEGREWSPVGVRGVIARTILGILATYRERHAVEFSALLAGSVYGPRQRAEGGVVAALVNARRHDRPAVLHGDGRQTRDLVYIDDAVDALARAATRAGGLAVNVGTGSGIAVRDVWQALGGGPVQHGDPDLVGVARLALSVTRARIQLGWAPWTDLATGLATLVV